MATSNTQSIDGKGNAPGLCNLCADDLLLDRTLASHITATGGLDLSGLDHDSNFWRPKEAIVGLHQSYRKKLSDHNEASGWASELHIFGSKRLRRHYRHSSAGGRHKRSRADLAIKTCRVCARLLDLFQEYYGEYVWFNEPDSDFVFRLQYEWLEESVVELEQDEDEEDTTLPPDCDVLARLKHFTVHVQHPNIDLDCRDIFQFCVTALSGDCREQLKIMQSPPDPDGPLSVRMIEFMKTCINDCMGTHKDCQERSSSQPFIPARLIKIDEMPNIRLVEFPRLDLSAHPPELSQIRYGALSYCWGVNTPKQPGKLMTTGENRKQHMEEGIPFRTMPRAFQDAILVARKLEIPYLWIDALCIIQDSVQDWETESVKMCSIFSHAFVTLCAATSSSSQDSFLQRQGYNAVRLPYKSPGGQKFDGEYFISLDGSDGDPSNEDLRGLRWQNRAWVWQEEVMSPRQLVFGKKMLQFRCRKSTVMENGVREESMIPDLREDLGSFWECAVRACSRRDITFTKDRLGVVSGVAKYFAKAQEAQGRSVHYVAGLWFSENLNALGHELVWYYKSQAVLPSFRHLLASLMNKDTYCAPSWSWASRNEGVVDHWYIHRDEAAFRVVAYDLQPAHSDAMVAVRYGSSVTLNGRFVPTPVLPMDYVPPTSDKSRFVERITMPIPKSGSRIMFRLDWKANEQDSEEEVRQRQLCLFFTCVVSERALNYTGSGLLLLPEDEHGLRYRRVGIFAHFEDSQWIEDLPTRDITII